MSTVMRTMCAIAATALAVAITAGAASPPRGGTIRAVKSRDVDSLDPAKWYTTETWSIAYATCRPLMNHVDAPAPLGTRVVPDGAAAPPAVRDDGRTYVFQVRRGMRFSDGTPLTAANYAAAMNRVLDPRMRAPGSFVIRDIVGAQEVMDGKARRASGIVARGRTLTIALQRARPDILTRLALPWFCPVPTDLPLDPAGVDFVPGSGPYYVAGRVVNRRIELRRNPRYDGRRPANADRIVIEIGGSVPDLIARVERGQADLLLDGIPQDEQARLLARYGPNKSQFRIGGTYASLFLVLNTRSALFRGNPGLRRAINFAVDRPSLLRAWGFLFGRRTDQLLHESYPGYRDVSIYPLKRPDLRTARGLAAEKLRGGRAVFYSTPGTQELAGLVRYQLKQIGLDVEIKIFSSAVRFEKLTTPGEPWDITFGIWFPDYYDPADVLLAQYGGPSITGEPYGNLGWFDVPDVNRRLTVASRLSGEKRYAAFQRLDEYVLRKYAPIVPYGTNRAKWLHGPGLGCVFNHPVQVWALGSFCVKRV